MFLNPDFSTNGSGSRICQKVGLGALAMFVLGACSNLPCDKPALPAEEAATLPPAALHAVPPAVLPADTVVGLLAYADWVRALPMLELLREIARLGNPNSPIEQLQLALSLQQLHQAAESARAQELLNRILSNPSAPAQPLHALARLLTARYADQRRLEEQLERQVQQTRDVQRRLEKTRERLEALKAIERSLTSRPAAP